MLAEELPPAASLDKTLGLPPSAQGMGAPLVGPASDEHTALVRLPGLASPLIMDEAAGARPGETR